MSLNENQNLFPEFADFETAVKKAASEILGYEALISPDMKNEIRYYYEFGTFDEAVDAIVDFIQEEDILW